MGSSEVGWYLTVFRKDSDYPDRIVKLERIGKHTLQRWFDQQPDNPMYASFPVGESQRALLEAHIGEALDFERYDYYVECNVVNDQP